MYSEFRRATGRGGLPRLDGLRRPDRTATAEVRHRPQPGRAKLPYFSAPASSGTLWRKGLEQTANPETGLPSAGAGAAEAWHPFPRRPECEAAS